MHLVKKIYVKGIEDCLSHILTEELTIEKIHEFSLKIKESRTLNFEKQIIDLASE